MKFLKKSKKKPKLYMLYKKELKAQTELKAKTEETSPLINQKVQKEEKVREDKSKKKKGESKKKITYPYIIRVQALTSGCGCTHIAETIGYLIKNQIEESVCIISHSSIGCDFDIDVFEQKDFYECCESYKYIILDLSDYQMKESTLAHIKIMVALKKDSYLSELAAFLDDNSVDSKEWIYFFNLVPKKDIEEVHDLMEDYKHWCLGAINPDELDSKTGKFIHSIIFE